MYTYPNLNIHLSYFQGDAQLYLFLIVLPIMQHWLFYIKMFVGNRSIHHFQVISAQLERNQVAESCVWMNTLFAVFVETKAQSMKQVLSHV